MTQDMMTRNGQKDRWNDVATEMRNCNAIEREKQGSSKGEGRASQGCTQVLPKSYPSPTQGVAILNEYAKSMARVWLEYGNSMGRVCLSVSQSEASGLPVRSKRTPSPKQADSQSEVSGLRALRYAVCVIMVMMGVNLWGQTDYSGVYYIGGPGYNDANTTSNYYLCPTEKWYYYISSSPYYLQHSDDPNNDNGQPFMTTYRCRDGNYVATKAVWIVEKQSNGYYHIQRKLDGKYLTFNVAMGDGSNAGRMRVHLEETADGDKALFTLTKSSNYFNIITKIPGADNGNRKYLNVTDGNKNSLIASGKNDGPKPDGTNAIAVGGIIGLWTSGDENTSKWYFEVPKPVISQGSDKTISISHQFGVDVNIYYTTDGTNPTTSSTLYTEAFLPEIKVSQIKAIATNTKNTVSSAVETFNLEPCPLPSIRYDNDTKEITISSTLSGAMVYYTTAADNPSTPDFDTENHSTDPITIPNITSKTVIKAFAAKQGYAPSAIITQTVEKVKTPVFDTSSGNSLVITCETEGATIYYTDDNSEPSTSWTVYRRPLTEGISGKSFRAFAVKANNITSDVAGPSDPITLGCAMPVIKRGSGNTFTLSCSFPTEGVTIYYTTNGSDLVNNPTSGTAYTVNTEIPFTGTSVTVKAIAVADGYNNSALAERTITEALSGAGTAVDPYLIESSGDFAQFIIKANGTGSGDYYKVTDDFTVGTTDAITTAFTGTFDGGMHTISNLGHALFNIVDGGVVKNVILDAVSVSGGTDAGAIANKITGTSSNIASIYNCGVLSGSISGSGYVGSIVGQLGDDSSNENCYARVINCYSFATVSGSNWGAGIVGYNRFSSTITDLRTMVMNCMFYGEISSDTKISPIYGGLKITNVSNLNGYNYYRFDANYSKDNSITDYNCALAAEEKYLTRFEFFRNMLNSNRELAAWYAMGDPSKGKGIGNACEMAKWVLDPAEKPYPILKTQGYYPSVINYEDAPTLDAISLTINESNTTTGGEDKPTGASINSNYPTTLTVYDKDLAHNHFNYRTVRLPYYNEVGTGNCTKNKVVTGWKITGFTGGTQGHFVNNTLDYSGTNHGENVYPPYNFADRYCTNKDLYDGPSATVGSDRVFSQGAYYDVPEGVTGITIEPYWGTAVYLSDPTYDVAYPNGYGDKNANAVFVSNMGSRYVGGNMASINDDNQTVYTDYDSAFGQVGSSGTVYDNAIVLVGNYHHYWGQNSPSTTKAFTIMSADLNNDCEPDYSFIVQHGTNRQDISAIRFDFINSPGLGMIQKVETDKAIPKHGIWRPKGWFEVTNTTLIQFTQFEYDNGGKPAGSPLILLGGIYDQFVTSRYNTANSTEYIHMGSNIWMKEFCNGTHTANANTSTTRHVPISVTGGEFESFYLTGTFQPNVESVTDNAECYINGGKFVDMAGAGQEQLKGDVTWLIDHADITNFYGGGINGQKPVTGNIYVEINNSQVGLYCGGPKFGNMQADKKVTTKAKGSTFGSFYGAGYGGTSYFRHMTKDKTGEKDWDTWVGDYTRKYVDGKGISTEYEYEFIPYSGGQSGQANYVGRFYVLYASLSLAETKNVESTLEDCHITGSFYGGGKLGRVDGNITSTLKDCTVGANVYGAGFSASVEKVNVVPKGAKMDPNPDYNESVGVFTDGDYPDGVEYTWTHAASVSEGNEFDDTNHLIYTTTDLTDLGIVTGNATLNIEGTTTVGGSVYGGGEESAINGNTEVNINGGTIGTDDSRTDYGNVFGGGNLATVGGSVTVNMSAGTVENDVYGGGALANTNVNNTTDPTVNTTTVNLTGGIIKGDAYGGGLGRMGTAVEGVHWTQEEIDAAQEGDPAYGKTTEGWKVEPVAAGADGAGAVKAIVYGDINVNLGCSESGSSATAFYINHYTGDHADVVKSGRVFGCNNLNGSPKGDVTVRVWKTVEGNTPRTAEDPDNTGCADKDNETHTYQVAAVYGGGNLADFTTTSKKANVIIETCNVSIQNVYGGGNAAAVPRTDVLVKGAYEIAEVFGGGNGKDKYTLDGSTWIDNPGANVNGNANTLLQGGYIHDSYGGSNKKGTITGNVNIDVSTGGTCTMDVGKVVGAGKDADVNGDLIMILGCKPSTKIPLLYAGADNANVKGNVELTITSGNFGKVFGGNNQGGAIFGHIKLNIEETSDCEPIRIDELYLGGNEAAYSQYGYYNSGTTEAPVYAPRTSETDEHTAVGHPTTDATHIFPFAQPELNVVSCTYIGKIFGGGYGSGAALYGNPTVNINMIQGKHAANISVTADNPNQLGAIGDIYGGGNAADVYGNTTVNIGTTTSVNVKSWSYNEETKLYTASNQTVLGANITGNVFGGGNEAKVSGNTYVNICGTQIADSESENGYKDTSVNHSGTEGFAVSIGNSVYGGGNAADVEGNTFVTFADGYVFNGIFGGGLAGSVGKFTRDQNATDWGHDPNDSNHEGTCLGKPTACEDGTGTCYVVVSGGQIGPIEVATQGMARLDAAGGPVPQGWVWGAGCGIVEDPTTHPDTHFKAYVNNTDVTIKDNAFILESIIGGGEFGRVLGNTLVKIKGGQIGVGEGKVDANNKPIRYTDDDFVDPTTTTITTGLATCSHFPFGKEVGGKKVYECYDPYADAYKTAHSGSELYPGGVTDGASDGKTWIGCVFAGGSGYMPYINKENNVITNYDWVRSAGWVEGNTEVRISGGHILTNVYGGNEYTDVKGTSKVIMTGGTVGVPRTKAQIEALPLCGYIFGAGKGDERTHFNTATNVGSAEVEVSGGIVYGSVYGGGEDGHVLGDVTVTIMEGAKIGTCGTSYFDGNVFGGGRGFSGIAQTAGTVGGNITLNIEGGKMLGSVYGGGRLASVGTMFEFPTKPNGDPNPAYGNFKEDEGGNTYGYVTVNISGGEIGRDFSTLTTLPAGAEHSGNVFGGSMGRLDLLNGTRNSIWPKMAQVKKATINISGNNTLIRRSVYGGGELGTVRDDAIVTISGGTIRRDVYGGGYGSEDRTYTVFSVYEPNSTNTGYNNNTYAFTPMQFAGCVGKSTTVNVSGGYIRKSIYGGGEMASVGIIDCMVEEVASEPGKDKIIVAQGSGKWTIYKNMIKHWDVDSEFALSWPYEFNYVPGYNGDTHVNITGGRLGLKGDDNDETLTDNGDVYGAGKGKAGDYKDYVFCANVGSTDVKIEYPSTPETYTGTVDCIAGAVYGGGEDGHVMGNTKLTLKEGLIYHSIYGGGSGKGTFSTSLLKIGSTSDYYTRDIYSIMAGKVFGNTEVNMTGGYVVRNVYGGGNMGSVGKGNYAGGTDDYSYYIANDKTYNGYGEALNGNLWSGSGKFTTAFLNSGKCTVKISGGTIGYIDTTTPSNSMYPYNSSASLPYGNVFGGCRGESAPNITESPRYLYSPEFFVGYANETEVTIEGANTKILGSVYGGGMDGHIRRDAHVIIKGGEIGIPFDATNKSNVQTEDPDDIQWLARGNVYGAGSGIGKYKYDFDYDGAYTTTNFNYNGKVTKEEDFSTSAGSVTRFTKVEIQGGTIHRNVYGGGSLASVGAPKIPADKTDNPTKAQTLNEVKISGGHIGGDYSYNESVHVYGGHVFGGSRGDASLDATKFSTSMFTSITIDANATPANSPVIYGSVFGGGEVGIVKGSVDVTLNGGTVNDDVYGGGALANTNTENPKNANGDLTSTSTYTTTVNLFGGLIKGDAYGGGLGQLGTNPIAAMVYGDVAVNLGKEDFSTATAFTTSYFTDTHAGVVKSGRVFGCNNLYGYPHGDVTVTVNKTVTGKDGVGTDLKRTTLEAKANNKVIKENNPENYESVTGYVTPTYEVAAVYGGGNLANYQAAAGKKASVIINSCDVSVQDVYGGGNAAEVPATEVLVNGAYEIGEVFGGGNGKDDYTLDGGTSWTTNPGANINGNTNTLLRGGLIHEAYGGSNEKGTITGNVAINTGEGQPEYCDGCPLDVEKLVGAGKNADVNGDLIVVLGCKPETKTPLVFGGADNANVNGNVELTITSGTFGKVFGGNNMGGIIKGHIVLNIEETGCNPIKIDELYLGGNEASYSIYGYYDSGTTNADGKKIYLPRTSATDEHAAIENPSNDDNKHPFPYAQPVLNVVSCTSIGKVFGGGYGVGGKMYADPTVNINMIQGEHADNISVTADNPNQLGAIGNVYGGGNAADVIGNPTVNIGAAATVQLHQSYTNGAYSMSEEKTVLGAYITGNVFGGGMGKDDTFTCEKAMVGIDGDGVANPNGGTTVNIYKGLVLGSVYGGGEVGRVEKNTVVTIGTGDGVDATTDTPTSAPEIRGSVFGGGKGLETHGYSALVRGNPTVVVQGNAKVRGNVYGGGQIASVARYNVAKTDDEGAPYGVKKDEPYALKSNTSGFCTVTIKGYAEIGPETIGEEVKTTSVGHVFGAGKGILPGGDYEFVQGVTKRMVAVRDSEGHITGSTWDDFTAGETDYITFIKTLALSSQTNVTIDGNAKVKGSVFGGSESGFVQFDANVNVLGGAIGTQGKGGADFGNVYGGGKGDVEYTGANHDYITAGIVKGNTKVVISQAEGKTTKILHNVYGGGAYGTVGEFEYDATTGMPTARKTYTIGSDVHSTTGGKAEIYITGGIIGTDGNENGMIFGSSRGDVGAPGSIHDKAAWVYDTHVAIGDTTATTTTIATPLIKGSVYGGGENGHNFHSSYVRINGGTIGIPEGEPIGSYTAGGASYPYRGNVYGGGCGTDMYDTDNDSKGDTYNPLAGIVRGDATIRMTAGTVAHNMYGAGAMGSVGTTDVATSGKTTIDISGGTIGVSGTVGDGNVFGAARGDKEVTEIGLAQVRETRVTVSSGQVMGNVYGGGEVGNVGRFTNQDPVSVGNYNWDTSNAGSGLCTVTINGGKIGPDDVALSKEHGNVFGGGKGVSNTFECEKAMVYKTNVTISNGSTVNGTVYGGGEVGRVENNTVVTIGTENGTDEPEIKGSVFAAGAGTKTHGYSALVRGTSSVTVQGKAKVLKNVYGGGEEASVGRYKVKTPANKDDDDVPESLPYGMPAVLLNGGTSTVVIRDQAVIGTDNIATAGHVYGAGQGVDPHEVAYTYQSDETKPSRMVSGNTWEYFASEAAYLQFVETLALTGRTDVTIDEGATVKGSVFGGSESGFVYHDTNVKIQNGTIKGDAFGGGRGLATFAEAGRVSGNTEIAVSGGVVEGNVYGGGNLGDVGTINKTAQTNYNYIWKNSDCNGNVNATGNNNVAENNKITGTNKNTGICKVTISGGTIGVENPDDVTKHGNVFGAGEGLANTWWCEKAIAYATNVNITKGAVYGNVYGGGQIGRVEDDAKVTIGDPSVTDALTITGSVFGAGAGLATHGYSALVRGNADVTVQGKAQIGGSVYGGGETASVGKFTVVGGLPKHPDSGGICTVVIKDNAAITGEVFGACKGVDPSTIAAADRKSMQLATNAPEEASLWSYYEPDHTFIWRTYKTDADYLAFLETLALTSNTDVTIDGSATINESVYGGGQRGITLGSVKVDVIGGIVNKDVYGGGALANTNKGNWDDDKGTWADGKTSADYTTTVNLLGGIVHDVYGGGLGDSNTPAIVYGDVKVNLNGLETDNYVEALHKTLVSDLDESPDNTYYLANDGCIVTGNVFGCNNINGTPKGHAKVHVFKTLAKTGQAADGYDVAAVYGGGNAADYVPDASESAQSTEVIIEGCDKTSIENVYGGGYGAATPGTKVLIRGTKIINNVFGGGYGAGENNPGANVGYKTGGTTSYGKSDGGKAIVQLMAGKVNNIYGGSNTKGDIRGGSSVTNVAKDGGPGCCDNLMVREVYGGGNEADMYGGAEIVLSCMPDDWIEEIYAGAKNADVENDVSLTLTSGKFGRVFGGNKSGGKIDGSITLNIEESEDCEAPLIIGELYGGGNEAAYSAYGYGTDGTPLTEAQARDAYTGEGEYPGGFSGPWVNVKSFTSIGNIYGGGKGQSATLIGNPRVLINEVLVEGNNNVAYNPDNDTDKPAWIDGVKVKLYPHEAGKMGVIGNVFGGGNAADVIGNTSIEIGTGDSRYNTDSKTKVWFESTFETKDVVGADIRGNVYGGGNEAQVTGNTNVVVGKATSAE